MSHHPPIRAVRRPA
ncbi:hypothetical protein CSHISOI_11278 [Colletotrichum shisoi]|uniref:Uncharacterized protein n=1 Tax=Colletotrichum shisoi TaxID=2078593 RepID=A0A5Q4BB75_9PEZI|nr:hypothetical protein CSHISOI_11278 [Colletotrichum shisoi]